MKTGPAASHGGYQGGGRGGLRAPAPGLKMNMEHVAYRRFALAHSPSQMPL